VPMEMISAFISIRRMTTPLSQDAWRRRTGSLRPQNRGEERQRQGDVLVQQGLLLKGSMKSRGDGAGRVAGPSIAGERGRKRLELKRQLARPARPGPQPFS